MCDNSSGSKFCRQSFITSNVFTYSITITNAKHGAPSREINACLIDREKKKKICANNGKSKNKWKCKWWKIWSMEHGAWSVSHKNPLTTYFGVKITRRRNVIEILTNVIKWTPPFQKVSRFTLWQPFHCNYSFRAHFQFVVFFRFQCAQISEQGEG